ncbi:MAG: cytochrome c3 family protein [Alphaproteobacteria bacterium]|nr:cytochrome c3 family protein [Alphaproteobacteria bacterium]
MQVEITLLTRRGAAVMRRSHSVTADRLRLGRGTDTEIQLADIRVELQTAALYERGDGIFIERLGSTPLRVRGRTVETSQVGPGDEVLIGPYRILFTEPPAGYDAALSVELVQPMGDALERLLAQSRIGLEHSRLSKRAVSWLLFAVLALLCLAAPIAAYSIGGIASLNRPVPPPDMIAWANLSWNPGELSNPHRFFAQQCATCHRDAFARVPDAACLECHGRIGGHVDPAAATKLGTMHGVVDGTRCAQCHEEHRGAGGLVIREAALCLDCHRSVAESAPDLGARDVTGYPAGHPQFRVTLVADAAQRRFERFPLGGEPKPADHPNLTFSHAAHLVEAGFPVLGYKPMICADCHVAEPGGQGFLPITYKGQCQRCHELNFDVSLPWKTVPHGDAAGVSTAVADFYARQALQGGVAEPGAPDLVRRAAGSPLEQPTESQRRDALAWVSQKTQAALGIIFDEKRGCGYCHAVSRDGDAFRVAPVILRTRFLPQARFDHARHAPISCTDCHDARHSETSAEVLIPGIEKCQSCHGGEDAALKAESTCTTCHGFHHTENGPMRQAAGATR